ncbi:MAG: hypothetical protein FWF37_01940 [Chloroflexi bacterium]|nr:hypothetical protein [Chloroflexota bacterium]
MKKRVAFLLIGAALFALSIFVIARSITPIDPYTDNPSPLKIEKTEWYIDEDSGGASLFYLEVTITNTSNKDIKAIKSYIGADLFWYDENNELGGILSGDRNSPIKGGWAITLQIDWPMNGLLKAGQTQTYSLPFCSVEYEFGSVTYNIHSLIDSNIMPYWVDFNSFGSSWGQKGFDIQTSTYTFHFLFYNSVRIPDFNPI